MEHIEITAPPEDLEPEVAAGNDRLFIARQPIVDRGSRIFAYELFFRGSADAERAEISNALESDVRVLINLLSGFGTEWLLGDRIAFLNASAEVLASDHFEALPPERVVIELQLPPQGTDDEVLPLLERWTERGYRFALGTAALHPSRRAWLGQASYLKIDVQTVGVARLEPLVRIARAHPALKLVAEKVETAVEFAACEKLGFNYFQGYHFARPQTLVTRNFEASQAIVVRLIQLVTSDAENAQIEEMLKRDPALAFKLLRYINSAGFGLSCELTSFQQAIIVLGRKKLQRWLTLLLLSATKGASPALVHTALVRGRLVELLAAEHLQSDERESAFMVGLFSLLDVIVGKPMNELVDLLSVPEAVADALLNRSGVYGPFLSLAEACEEDSEQNPAELAGLLHLDPGRVARAHFSALTWADSVAL